MKTAHLTMVFPLVVALSAGVLAQAGRRAGAAPKKAEKCAIHEPIHEDIAAQVAKFKLVSMPFSVIGLSPNETKMIYKLVDASRYLESIYWRQSDPKGLALFKRLVTGKTGDALIFTRADGRGWG
ncbi:MAG: hypothetical protein ACRD4I_08280, partial [Candidatus Angelobacter sp.]